MSDSQSLKITNLEVDCRRCAERIALPIELEIATDSGPMIAIVRDVSFDTNPALTAIGIAVFHCAKLPNRQPVRCRTLDSTERLPHEFQLEVKWSRRFGPEGYLSGGVIGGGAE